MLPTADTTLAPESRGLLAIEVDSPVRLAFLKKVYALFSLAITVFAGTAWLGIETGYAVQLTLKVYGSGFLGLILLFAVPFLVLRMTAHAFPMNIVALLGFAVFEGFLTGGLIAIFTGYFHPATGAFVMDAASGVIVAKAAAMTGVTFTGLTLYTLTNKRDFSFLGGALWTGFFILVGFGILSWIFGFDMGNVYSLLWVVLMAGFVLYDTSNIMRRYPVNQPATAAVVLFLDFVILFKHLLMLLSRRD